MEKFPWELIEEVLSRVPPKSLVRFKTVSKQWNTLFNDKTFINNHKTTFRFILTTKSKIYSVSIDPKIEVHELSLDIPGNMAKNLIECDGFLLCKMDKGALVWNPWLRQTRWIKPEVNQPSLSNNLNGIGYDPGSGYKALVSYQKETNIFWKTHDFVSGTDHELMISSNTTTTQVAKVITLAPTSVSLNGSLYWVSCYDNSYYFLMKFNFSNEKFKTFCDLPCGDNHHEDALVLGVFNGDRFSLLKQSHLTNKIEVWLTKNKIDEWCGINSVEWVKFMEVSAPNTPSLSKNRYLSEPSYFIDNKRLVVCSCDEIGRAWIYVMGNSKLISKTKIDLVVDPWLSHCTYFPNLASVPRGQREEKEVQTEVQV